MMMLIPADFPFQKIVAALDQFSLIALMIICVAFGIGLTATVLAVRACWPAIAEELDMILVGNSSCRRFLLGLINGPILFILAVIVTKILPLIGLILLCGLFILAILGLVAEMSLMGRRVLMLRSQTCSLFAQSITGGITIVAMFLLPLIGQAVFMVLLFRSLGTGIYWLFKRKKLPRPASIS